MIYVDCAARLRVDAPASGSSLPNDFDICNAQLSESLQKTFALIQPISRTAKFAVQQLAQYASGLAYRIAIVLRLCRRHATRARRNWTCADARIAAAVVGLHLLFAWLIAISLRANETKIQPRDLQAVLFRQEKIALPPPPLPPVSLPAIAQPPEVIVQPDALSTAPASVSSALVLAPRPDPGHINAPPTSAALGMDGEGGSVACASVVLKIEVQLDGGVSDASVVRPCGLPQIDRAVVRYVEANWRFIPAKLLGNPIVYWTTVAVPIRPAD